MGLSDSSYSYIHFTNPNQGLYMERWCEEDPIPFDDIDTTGLFEATANLFPEFLLEEEEDGAIPINSANFSAKYYKNKKLLKDRVWMDLGIYDRFLNEDNEHNKLVDQTILRPIHSKTTQNQKSKSTNYNSSYDSTIQPPDELTIAQFLMNGYGPSDNFDNILSNDLANDSIMGNNTSDLSINLNTEFIPPNFAIPKRNNSNNNNNFGANQTPRIGRARQPSNDRSYQTPISRMLRRNFTE